MMPRARVEERHPDGLPSRRAERVGAFALRLRNGLQHFARNRRRERNHHDRQDDQRADEHADAEWRAGEKRHALQPRRRIELELADERDQDEDAPEAVDDRRNRREQFGQEHERFAASTAGASSEMKMAMPSAIGVEISSARIDEYSVPQMNGRAPNSLGDRVPDVGLPELPAELLNRQRRLASQLERDRRNDQR